MPFFDWFYPIYGDGFLGIRQKNAFLGAANADNIGKCDFIIRDPELQC